MSRSSSSTLTAVLAALLLALPGTACNDIGDEPSRAEAVVIVTGVTIANQSVTSINDTTATLDLKVENRGVGVPSSFFNDVTFTNYSVAFAPTGVVPDIPAGAIGSGYVPMGGTASLLLIMVPVSSKPAAGTTVVGDVKVEGHDVLGNPLSFDAQVAITFTP